MARANTSSNLQRPRLAIKIAIFLADDGLGHSADPLRKRRKLVKVQTYLREAMLRTSPNANCENFFALFQTARRNTCRRTPPDWQASQSLVRFDHLKQAFSTGDRREQT
jgi:hypothetical protein